jgi:hypothetical protein
MTRLRCAHNIGGGHRAAFATGDYSSVARLAGASDRANAKQFDLRRLIFLFHRFLIRQRGPQVLLVVVAEDRHYHRVGTHHFLRANGGEEIASRGNPHGQPQCVGHLLRNQNRIAIVNGDHPTQFFELNNRGCELVRNPVESGGYPPCSPYSTLAIPPALLGAHEPRRHARGDTCPRPSPSRLFQRRTRPLAACQPSSVVPRFPDRWSRRAHPHSRRSRIAGRVVITISFSHTPSLSARAYNTPAHSLSGYVIPGTPEHSSVALLLWAVVAEVRYNVSSNYFMQRGQVAT